MLPGAAPEAASMRGHEVHGHLRLSPEEELHLRSHSAATVGSADVLAGQLPLHQPAFGDGIWARTKCISWWLQGQGSRVMHDTQRHSTAAARLACRGPVPGIGGGGHVGRLGNCSRGLVKRHCCSTHVRSR